ncbi:hypothetical protein HJB90_08980 [Rhizobium sp. NLR10a]|uniref:hypothetical protein n=1 Tax=unclassified Rhizobium TaxID=2613769 RepID=UPI001C8357DE|nr:MULTISPECIES: hypothetical protein [unclassified Rhizobium]MBX5213978.1 hypothetical protein [Rhizobium sp. NLR9a]MBX5218873.1 hypothetical protein [Rhizobium sp. NLR8a]MBX5275367.1 hypothetical protein [Rhizobium sp. NLR13a]MBX5281154.1 hypothetical protein [Rhizobium sp. NLR10a]MBX5297550.1 hypothetical protein [Rhizobium sp. NLR15a]
MAGSSLRIGVPDLREAANASPLLKILLHFTPTIMMQTVATASAADRYTVDERVARFILMSHDRIDGDEIIVPTNRAHTCLERDGPASPWHLPFLKETE